MGRAMMSDDAWSSLQEPLREVWFYITDRLRENLEAVFYRIRAGCPWRDLSNHGFAKWTTTYKWFNRNSKNGKFEALFSLIKPKIDRLRGSVDSTTIKVHQHGCGARKGEETLIGQSCGGRTTKIHCVVDRYGTLDFAHFTQGASHDAPTFEGMIDHLKKDPYKFILADKAYTSNAIKSKLADNGMTPCIPDKSNAISRNPFYSNIRYKKRHIVENFFCRIKRFRAMATRFDKLGVTFKGTAFLTFTAVNLGLRVPT